MEKRRGDEHGFIPGRGLGWQMESAPTPYRTLRTGPKLKNGPRSSTSPGRRNIKEMEYLTLYGIA
jgi:hypothetical protein